MSGLTLIWVTFALASGLALASYLGRIRKWPKVFYVSAVSNAMVLALFYTPSMYGYHYYFANIIKTVPLIIALVILCREDPSPDWTYRGMWWVLFLQLVTGGWHILSSLQSPYYDQLALAATVMELIIIITGGLNARLPIVARHTNNSRSTAVCSLWVKRNKQGGA